jgi:hypothetical protein
LEKKEKKKKAKKRGEIKTRESAGSRGRTYKWGYYTKVPSKGRGILASEGILAAESTV